MNERNCPKCGKKMVLVDYGNIIAWRCNSCGYEIYTRDWYFLPEKWEDK